MAFQTAELLFHYVFCYFGIPEDIVSDRGPQFTSKVWPSFLGKLEISVSLTLGYHPQANGQKSEPRAKLKYLPWVEYTQNSLCHSSMGLTAFQCMLGFQPPMYPWNEHIGKQTHQQLERAIKNMKRLANRRRGNNPQYKVGERVSLATHDLHPNQGSRKPISKYIGPYQIHRETKDVTYDSKSQQSASYVPCLQDQAS